MCKYVGHSRLGLHVRGDTFGSNRLWDNLLSETVPVFTQNEQYDVLPPFMPWRRMSVFANSFSEESFLSDLHLILSNATAIYNYEKAKKFNIYVDARRAVDWSQKLVFELYMSAFQSFIFCYNSSTMKNYSLIHGCADTNLRCGADGVAYCTSDASLPMVKPQNRNANHCWRDHSRAPKARSGTQKTRNRTQMTTNRTQMTRNRTQKTRNRTQMTRNRTQMTRNRTHTICNVLGLKC